MVLSSLRTLFLKELKKFSVHDFYNDRERNSEDLFLKLMRRHPEEMTKFDSYKKVIFSLNKGNIGTYLNGRAEDLRDKLKKLEAEIEDKNRRLSGTSRKDILKMVQQNLRKLSKDNSNFKTEYDATDFFSILFTNMSIDAIKDWQSGKKKELSIPQLIDYFKPFLKNDDLVIPTNWRELLLKIFDTEMGPFTGYLREAPEKKCIPYRLVKEEHEPNSIDIGITLAFRLALRRNEHVIVTGSSIAIYLSGGVLAQIKFSLRNHEDSKNDGNLIERYHKERNYFSSGPAVIFQNVVLYGSSVSIKLPVLYYFIIGGYILEITFSAAPILFENNTVMSKNNIDDEIREEAEKKRKEEEEEEERRRMVEGY